MPEVPAGKKHVVEKGETLWSIAQDAYGDGNLWVKLKAANPHIDPDRLAEGQEITLPPKDVLTGKKPTAPTAKPDTATPLSATTPGSGAKATDKTPGKATTPTTPGKPAPTPETGKPATTPEAGKPATPPLKPGAEKKPDATKPATDKKGEGETKPKVKGRTHVVQAGESLASIARAVLGNASRWREIYELNKSQIADPDRLLVGTTLQLPEK
jgi:nucleoid-associated protein YgaU